jgi:Ca2+-binding RTX toxin-like protein
MSAGTTTRRSSPSRANGTRVRVDRLSPEAAALDIGTTENIGIFTFGGNDTCSATGNLAALTAITMSGGAGDDILLGSNGSDILQGGDDNDFIDGQQGNDFIYLGAGDDTVQWDPGDGSDIIEGDAGNDRLVFNGSATNEQFNISTVGERVRFTRNIATINLDFAGIETFDLNALGGADIFNISQLTGTGLTRINANLAGTLGGSYRRRASRCHHYQRATVAWTHSP